MQNYLKGLKDGIPIGLGYISVSFTFGLIATSKGFYWWQALLISMLVLTSAGQFSAIDVMLTPGRFVELIISQITINIRYSFMSISLSQKVDEKFGKIFRLLYGFFITDEIFAVASMKKEVTRSYFGGLSTMPWIGWTAGTLLGAIAGNVLPASIITALGITIYAMFIAIITPGIIEDMKVAITVSISVLLSLSFYYVPVVNTVPVGFSISICAVVAALVGALLLPVSEVNEDE
ncbi:MAG: AzlC family ABC transporter permease [Eubacterium sp.]|nr:AzlC family ABC transporter permease [Eubacterium sp.]